MSRKVFLAMPCLRGHPDLATQACLTQTMCELQAAGVRVTLKMYPGDAIIARLRNVIVAEFLASDCTDLVMLDDDIIWEPGALLRLLSHPHDLVAGVYPKRQDVLEFPVRRIPGKKVDLATGLLEVELVPSGFMCMTRSMLARMTEHYAHLEYADPNAPDELRYHRLFWVEAAPGLDPNPRGLPEVWGEDFTFCRRWREMGGTVWLDTLLKFGHSGRKTWWGCYAESMPVAAMFEAAA